MGLSKRSIVHPLRAGRGVRRLAVLFGLVGLFACGWANAAQASSALSENWESGTLDGWTVADTSSTPDPTNDPQWQVLNNPQTISVNPGINPPLVTLPDPGSLPAANDGTNAAWFGDTSSGTFCGADWASVNKGATKNGCTSREAFSGTLTSPTFSLVGASSAVLHFASWWEIEGVNSNSFDLLQVEYSTDGGTTWSTPVKLNPANNPSGGPDTTYSNNGSQTSPTWQDYIVDLSGAIGSDTVKVRFNFSTGDNLYNGFRGWLVDSISVNTPYDAGAPAISSATVCAGTADAPVTAIHGANFVEGSTALVDGSPASGGTNTLSSSTIEVSQLVAGTHSIAVQTPNGTTSNTIQVVAGNCAAPPAPAVTAISPTSGPSAGGTTITISGSGFTGATAVEFGSTAALTSVISDNSITATAPAGTGTVDITVTGPGGTSPAGSADQYTYVAAPTITSVSPNAGPTRGGTTVTITGTGLAGATAVAFGATAATSFTVDSATQITATAPAASAGTVDVTAATAVGTSTTSSADHFTFVAFSPGGSTRPALTVRAPSISGSTAARFAGTVNPNGLPTTAHFEYKLDPALGGPASPTSYDHSTPTQTVGSDTANHPFTARVTQLLPNALYHVRLVAANPAGRSFGPDQTFKTAHDPAPPPPTLGKSFNVVPVRGEVFIRFPGGHTAGNHAVRAAILTKGAGFVPLTEARQIPTGSLIDARAGTLQLVTATGKRRSLKTGTFSGGLFKPTQGRSGITKGVTTLTLLENLFHGAPGYSRCGAVTSTTPALAASSPLTAGAAKSNPILQTLHARDNHGKFRTKGRYSAGTVRGTIWDTIDSCAGTTTKVYRGTVNVYDYGKRKNITVHAGHSYLAKAFKRRRGK